MPVESCASQPPRCRPRPVFNGCGPASPLAMPVGVVIDLLDLIAELETALQARPDYGGRPRIPSIRPRSPRKLSTRLERRPAHGPP